MTKSIIGKKYIGDDNSYAVNLTSASNHPYLNEQLYLAGTSMENAKICEVVSEPFDVFIRQKIVKMIAVSYNNTTSIVLFDKKCICDDNIFQNGIPINWEELP